MAIRGRLKSAGRFIGAAVVAVLTFACTADAIQTTTTPNTSIITYSVAGGAFGPNWTPPSNTSVHLIGNCLTVGDRGVGEVALIHIPGSFIEWAGVNSPANGTVTSGFSGSTGTHIVQIDFGGSVWIEVGSTPDTVRVHNTADSARAGTTTWIW
jgi:hypothetical protein